MLAAERRGDVVRISCRPPTVDQRIVRFMFTLLSSIR
jgi:hypothetical protein